MQRKKEEKSISSGLIGFYTICDSILYPGSQYF